MPARAALPILLLFCASIAACGSSDREDVAIAFIGDEGSLFDEGLRLSPAAQHARAATAEGLVAIDEKGDIVPAIAERWIVTDDGLSYIFRLRNSDWPDGTPVTGESVRDELRALRRRLDGTSLGLDLAPVSEIRAMTGRVVEVRLASPVPDFLRLLAQPEMGLVRNGGGTGPMMIERTEQGAMFTAVPPERRGLPAAPNWQAMHRPLRAVTLPPEKAVRAFDAGAADLVLNGRLAALPLVDTGPLSRGTVRLDAALGLFGLRVTEAEGFLGEPARREALAMAVDRETLMAPFNIAGWIPTSRVVAEGLPGDQGTIGERWQSLTLEQRRSEAARRVAAWEDAQGAEARIRVSLAPGPGSVRLFQRLAADWSTIGVAAVLVGPGEEADLRQVDVTARFADPRWYLNQFACRLGGGLCSPEADALVRQAVPEPDPLARAALLAEAEAELTALNAYIPLGAPVRWSLVRSDITGFVENVWSVHPLFPLSRRPM